MRRWMTLVVAALLLAGCRGTPPPQSAQVGDLARSAVDLANACPEPTTDLPYPPGGRLPRGAVVVRACPSPKEYPWRMPRIPIDALTVDADRVVDNVNSLQPVPEHIGCTMQGGTAMDLWFGYPGERVAAVHVDTGGCGWTFTGPRGDWSENAVDGPQDPLEVFQDALLDQRESTDAPHTTWRRPRCNPAYQTAGLVRLRPGSGFATGTYCVLQDSHWRSAAIPAGLLRSISGELERTGSPGHCRHPFTMLRLVTTWGERQDMFWARCTVLYPTVGGQRPWLPSPEVLRAFDDLPLSRPYWLRRPNGTIVR